MVVVTFTSALLTLASSGVIVETVGAEVNKLSIHELPCIACTFFMWPYVILHLVDLDAHMIVLLNKDYTESSSL